MNKFDVTIQCEEMENFFKDVIMENEARHEEILLAENKLPLYNYQEEGVKFMLDRLRKINADEMGLGKTLQSIAETLRRDPQANRHVLIVSPKTAKLNWKKEIQKWVGEEVTVLDSKLGILELGYMLAHPETRFTIMNYEMFRKLGKMAAKTFWANVVFDEAHKLRNHKSQSYKGVKEFLESNPLMPATFLTGTPLVNTPYDLYSLLHLIDPYRFTNRERWVQSWFWIYGGKEFRVKNSALFKDFISQYMIRRLRKEVIELPKIQSITTPIELEDDQLRLYERIKNDWITEMGDKEEVLIANMLAWISRLKQAALAPDLTVGIESCEGAKTEELLNILEESDGQTIIVSSFAKFLRPLKKLLIEKGYRVGSVIGGDSEDNRSEDVDKFQAGELDVILLSSRTGGEAITLTAGNQIIWTDKPWTAAEEDQVFGRIYRIGQDKKVIRRYLKAVNTIEDYIEEVIDRKRQLFGATMPVHQIRKMLGL